MLTKNQIDDGMNEMPGGALGFLKEWGYQQFARWVELAVLNQVRARLELEKVPSPRTQYQHQYNAGIDCMIRSAVGDDE